MKTRKE